MQSPAEPKEKIQTFLTALRSLLPAHIIFTDPAECQTYSYDNSRYQALPDVVVLPQNHEHVAALVKTCFDYEIPLTARGRGTNTTGAAVPLAGGVVVSLERMNQVLNFDPANRTITVEAGVLNQTVQDVARSAGFFWPPDPTSAAYSSIGGNLACNAGGPRALKFGACRENTLALKAVTGTGATLKTGFYTSKYSVGYDLTRLLVGSEGTLAIITEATLKLHPLPENIFTFSAFFNSSAATAQAISALMQQAYTPWTLEYVDGEGLRRIQQCSGLDIPESAEGMLIVEIDGASELFEKLKTILFKAIKSDALLQFNCAETPEQAKNLWQVRKSLSPALKQIAPDKINEDIVVPVSKIPNFMDYIEQVRQKTEIIIVVFGHAGNGNLHVNLLFDRRDLVLLEQANQLVQDIFALVLKLGGTLSGEHGIGMEKKAFIPMIFDETTLNYMRQLKSVFDPKGILNPGKIWD